jgi:hypothetical protein
MARHTIGDRRGSVRGAPPDVYLAFMHSDSDDLEAQWAPTFTFFKAIFVVVPAFVIVGFVFYVFWCAITGRPVYEIPE